MKQKGLQYLLFLIILTSCSANLNYSDRQFNSQESTTKTTQTAKTECQIYRVEKIIDGNSMLPLLKNGQKINLLENYYKCGNAVQKGDIVAYHYGGNKHPLIKRVRVISDDLIEVIGSKLSVNGEILKNSVGKEYIFSTGEMNMLKLYIKDSHIPQNTFFLFGDNVSVSTDSRKFGAVSAVDFLGKFEFETDTE